MEASQSSNLWAPWRIDYIKGLTHSGNPASACFLCDAAAAEPDSDQARQRLVLLHDPRGMIVLNRYPYTNGHLMVTPNKHLAELADMTAQQRHGLMDLVVLAERLLKAAINPQGINVGINLGRCAGAGLPGHLHVHLVPRWHGDTNFMHVVGQVRVIPQALQASYDHLDATLKQLLDTDPP